VRVARSIYSQGAHAGSHFDHDAASIVAPSDQEFDFDDLVINSGAYRRVMAHAQAKIQQPTIQEPSALGDLMHLTDTSTSMEHSPPAAPLAVFRDLEGLTMFCEPLAREQTIESSEDQGSHEATAAGEPATDPTWFRGSEHKKLLLPPRFADFLEWRGLSTCIIRPEPESRARVRCTKCTFSLTGLALRVPTPEGDLFFRDGCFQGPQSHVLMRCPKCSFVLANPVVRVPAPGGGDMFLHGNCFRCTVRPRVVTSLWLMQHLAKP
jgi:hypothetical protein